MNMWTLTVLVIGMLIGWNVPRPDWMKRAQDAVIEKARDVIGLN